MPKLAWIGWCHLWLCPASVRWSFVLWPWVGATRVGTFVTLEAQRKTSVQRQGGLVGEGNRHWQEQNPGC